MTKLTYEEWEKEYIQKECTITEEEIESWKTKYYCGLNTYEEFKSLLKHEYECYCENEEKMTKLTYEEWAKENPIDWDTYDDDEEDGMITEMHYQLYLWRNFDGLSY